MTWQDVTFTVVGLVFMANLVPTLRNTESRVPRITSIGTALGLFVIAFTDWTIHLPLSAIQTCGTATMWLLIAWLRPVREETK